MPGIAGFMAAGPAAARTAELERMVSLLAQGRPGVSGRHLEMSAGLYVGWVAHPGSFGDPMPVWNEAHDIGLILTGEEHSGPEQLPGLRAQGHVVGPAQADYLVHLYEELGDEFLPALNGWFAGLLIDRRRSRVLLFNDRYGLGRICYHQTGPDFYFASEAKVLLARFPELRQLQPRALAESWTCGCVLEDRTLYPGISLLPPGSAWTLPAAAGAPLKRERYFVPASWEALPASSSADYYEGLRETFRRVLPRYFRGDQRVAMSLTGGLDGRMIMAWAARPAGTLPCYTFVGPYRECADHRIARRVAQACRQPHQSLPLTLDFLKQFPTAAEEAVWLSDGEMDVTGAVEVHLNRLARQVAPVRLTGNYGSEILRGHVAFRPRRIPEGVLSPDCSGPLAAAVATYQESRRGDPLSFIAFRQVPWHHHARLSVEQSQLTVRSPFLDNDLVAQAYRVPRELLSDPRPSLRLIQEGSAGLGAIPTDRGVTATQTFWTSWVRRQAAEFLARVEYAFDYGMPDWLARTTRILEPLHLDRQFLGIQKFYHFRLWYRHELAGYLKEVLLDPRSKSRPYLAAGAAERLVLEHTQGVRNHTLVLHKLLSLELLQRRLLD